MAISDKWQRDRFRFGICDVEENYRFYFKWLLSKLEDVIVLKDVPETIDVTYLKEQLLLLGEICITDFNDKLYACVGSRGGEPNEYYRPTQFIIANPILGSKVVDIDKNGVVIFNTSADKSDMFGGGLFQLIKQTATLLADNIVSINCAQINTRVEAIVTSDSEAQATAGEIVLKKLYAGAPYNIVRSDIIEKININPIASSTTGGKIKELVELHQYIIAQFFQAIGIKANAINKKERMITDEINSQDDYLGISLLDLIESWKEGFDKVNEMYGTEIKVELNPILIERITSAIEEIAPLETEAETEVEVESEPALDESASEDKQEEEVEESSVEEETETEPETVEETIEEAKEAAEEIIEAAADTTEESEVKDDESQEG